MCFVLRTNCLPLNRAGISETETHNATVKKSQAKFDPEGIINSPQYSRIFDEDQRDFLIKCLQHDPAKRATAKELLKHKWITKNFNERQKFLTEQNEVRQIFAK